MSKTVLFELGVEELPARVIEDALKQLTNKTEDWMKEQRIPFEKVEGFATPRRLAVKILNVEEKQDDRKEEAKGPAKKIAVNENGEWTKAAIGFSKGQGKDVDDLYFKEVNGTEYVHLTKFTEGKDTCELFKNFESVFLSLNFPKTMRWGSSELKYVRPIRWIVALFGEEVIPLSIGNVSADRMTRGHRFLGKDISLTNADGYEDSLKDEFVLVSVEERKQRILDQLNELENENQWALMIEKELLNEVTQLVEYPTAFSGSFDEEFLKVPEEALITSMKEHQRYFPVRSQHGDLLPYFVGVRNGDSEHIDIVSKGNEKVLKARLKDAQFFYEEDQKGSLEEKLAKLEKMVYQEELGTLADKVNRITAITGKISEWIELDEADKKKAKRAAELCKFDLVTQMVDEFTELQGVMGEKYARISGEDEDVAVAINEHYMPRHANGALPSTQIGTIVSLADKLDTVVGSISIGIIPTGSQDPYGLRRQALGILQMLKGNDLDISVEKLIGLVHNFYHELGLPTREFDEVNRDLHEFFKVRAAYLLREDGIDPDVIDAVLNKGIHIYSVTSQKAALLVDKRNDEAFRPVHEALGRVLNLAKQAEAGSIDKDLFENETEHKLYEAYNTMHTTYIKALENKEPKRALEGLSQLSSPIHNFFDQTMVMAEDQKVRANRLRLLYKIAEDIEAFADFNAVQWKQSY